ncbi:MAG: sel1 repeat family protein [Alphaproteobacteria bacterium]|nr:sel1 repeat family protein [Alphaproteobacteria bacterium]
MIAFIRALVVCLSATVLFFPPALADEAQEKLLDQALAAYDEGDFEAARSIILPLAHAEYPDAMNALGLMYHDGFVFLNDPEKGCDWFERAANAGNPASMYNLSVCFNSGHGRPKNETQMLRWRTMAAKNGSTNAMINLSSRDKTEGEEYRYWMKMAADHGSTYAKVSLWLQDYEDDVAWCMTAR